LLTKITIEAALNTELDDHLGYDKHEESGGSNSRNGYSSKSLTADKGQFDIDVPRECDTSIDATSNVVHVD